MVHFGVISSVRDLRRLGSSFLSLLHQPFSALPVIFLEISIHLFFFPPLYTFGFQFKEYIIQTSQPFDSLHHVLF